MIFYHCLLLFTFGCGFVSTDSKVPVKVKSEVAPSIQIKKPITTVNSTFQEAQKIAAEIIATNETLLRSNIKINANESANEKHASNDVTLVADDAHSPEVRAQSDDFSNLEANFTSDAVELGANATDVGGILNEFNRLGSTYCTKVEQATWAYLTDFTNEVAKNEMITFTTRYDEIKLLFWDYLKDVNLTLLHHKKQVRQVMLIKQMGTSSLKYTAEIRTSLSHMEKAWSSALVCPYTKDWEHLFSHDCSLDEVGINRMGIQDIMRNSRNYDELAYYWNAWRDATGKPLRTHFKTYVEESYKVAKRSGHEDFGEMWRQLYDEANFQQTAADLWSAINPLYELLHSYVRRRLATLYGEDFNADDDMIPAHILGDLWSKDWTNIYDLVEPYPEDNNEKYEKVLDDEKWNAEYMFSFVNDYYTSLGLDNMNETYEKSIWTDEGPAHMACEPSSHDMCSGNDFRIKMCAVMNLDSLQSVARQLGHIQYYMQYKNEPLVFRQGPIPAFHEAFADLGAAQVMLPPSLELVSNPKAVYVWSKGQRINHLMRVALQKLPTMVFSYILDKWRREYMKISPPVARTSIDLDPASEYHVISNYQYIAYFVAFILEFQMLKSLCKVSGQYVASESALDKSLHMCNLRGSTKAGLKLRNGMRLGASEDWRTVLKEITGEEALSVQPLLEYFEPLREYLQQELTRNGPLLNPEDDMTPTVPLIIGVIIVLLVLAMSVGYVISKKKMGEKVTSYLTCSKKRSLDIRNDGCATRGHANEAVDAVADEKV